MKRKSIIFIVIYFIFIFISFFLNFRPAIEIGFILLDNSIKIIRLLPFIFILIGLFEVWVKKETVKRHLSEEASFLSYIWAILLGGITVGPMFMVLPLAQTLFNKGACLSIIFTFIGSAAICRIPMTVFESSYLGIKFTMIRYLVSLPLLIATSWVLGKYLQKNNYKMIHIQDKSFI